jgi:hypothetical protein
VARPAVERPHLLLVEPERDDQHRPRFPWTKNQVRTISIFSSVEAAPEGTRAVTACSAIGASAVGCLPVETGRICPSGRQDQGRLAPKERIGRLGEFQNGRVLTQQMLPILGEKVGGGGVDQVRFLLGDRDARYRSIVSPTEVAWTSALW